MWLVRYVPESPHTGRESVLFPDKSSVAASDDMGRMHYFSISWNLATIILFLKRNYDANGSWNTNYLNSTLRFAVNIIFDNHHSTSYCTKRTVSNWNEAYHGKETHSLIHCTGGPHTVSVVIISSYGKHGTGLKFVRFINSMTPILFNNDPLDNGIKRQLVWHMSLQSLLQLIHKAPEEVHVITYFCMRQFSIWRPFRWSIWIIGFTEVLLSLDDTSSWKTVCNFAWTSSINFLNALSFNLHEYMVTTSPRNRRTKPNKDAFFSFDIPLL